MTRTARDCALMLQAIAGYDPLDPSSVDLLVPDMLASLDGSLAGSRIGVMRDFFDVPGLETEVKDAVETALEALAAAGATVLDVSIPHADLARQAQRVIMYCEAFAYHEPDLRSRPQLYGIYTRQNLRQGALFSGADYVQAQRVRSLVKLETAAALADVDVLITPSMLGVAPRFDSYDFEASFKMPSLMAIWNLTGSPAMSVSCGFSDSGLPIGMQIIGKPFDEPTIFKIADAYQAITDWHLRAPDLSREAQPA
jgi:aspartyl-tRNA(Asn)/glutamyl-tRNA(Gln) amidotransferase subunit A